MKTVEWSEVMEQEGDCCGDEEWNHITLKTADGGGGTYLVISTARWALNDATEIDAFAEALRAFLLRK